MSKRKLTLVLLVVAVGLAGWTGYRERLRVTAWVWHVRHGGVLRLADYLIPVPTNWYVEDYGAGDQILIRLDHDNEVSGNSIHLPATISLLEEPPLKDINYWEAVVTARYKKNGTDAVLHREISLDGETLDCVGGNALPAAEAKTIPIGVSWDCRSTGPLEILITGEDGDLSEAWDFISRIRNSRTSSSKSGQGG
ncbi:MAG TPA: hypothetical protein VKB26_11960 [Candidatus Acidoferrales bacterium]|nr:hypothetical protein [Candidatus Acidoferrales bacterium]